MHSGRSGDCKDSSGFDLMISHTHTSFQFSGMQLQIEYGNYNPDRHKPGFIDNLKSVLPAEYAKVKGVEKKIYVEHKKLSTLTELTVKFRYITMCRSLNTYGITFFTVKEKVKGKNKLVTRLLGITRESVMRMDDKTKEVRGEETRCD